MQKQTILIGDDTDINRAVLHDILSDYYDIEEARDGREVLQCLKEKDIALVLLDIIMPEMDGFEVLLRMQKDRMMDYIPVIIISSETSSAFMRKGFEYGVCDYISRPFDPGVVLQRVRNTILLYSKQDQLRHMVTKEMKEKEKNSTLMVDILSTVLEFRNGESGLHVTRVRIITEILLEALRLKFPEYHLTKEKIFMISNAAAMHDLGKISIPDEILNKPGRLTKEEFEVMKQHTVIGDEMLENLHLGKHELLTKHSREICRWHHERWDGRGYPDGLVGDNIPIAAQVVSLADVYDALTSKRVYKDAYSHQKAVQMIKDGECGIFNPKILQCFLEEEAMLEEMIRLHSNQQRELFSERKTETVPGYLTVEHDDAHRSIRLMELERVKYDFYMNESKELLFDYDESKGMIYFSRAAADIFQTTVYHRNQHLADETSASALLLQVIDRILQEASCEDGAIEREILLAHPKNGNLVSYRMKSKVLWKEEHETYQHTGVVGFLYAS